MSLRTVRRITVNVCCNISEASVGALGFLENSGDRC